MRKLVVCAFLTLDGVMQAPGGPDEDRDGGFEHGGWSVNYWDDAMGQFMDAQFAQFDALLLGRKTYQIFAAHWPRVTDAGDPVATKLNSTKKYVASSTLGTADWNNSTVLRGDLAAEVAKLKDQPGAEIQVQGSWKLIQTLMRHNLVDEYRLWVFPVLLGTGKRLFADGTSPSGLRLTETKASTTGVLIHHYESAGKLDYGSFALDQ